jgi:GTP-binding protein
MDVLNQAKFLLSETDPGRLPESAAEVAFVGRSNVGKSTLLNALCRKPLARVSNTPGRTRLINVFETGGGRWIVDLPGYGFAMAPREERDGWGAMIEAYLTGRPALKMVFTLIDGKVGPTRLDLQMIQWLEANRLPWRAVATKTDQVKPSMAAARRRDVAHGLGLKPEEISWVSSDKGLGLPELRGEIAGLLA